MKNLLHARHDLIHLRPSHSILDCWSLVVGSPSSVQSDCSAVEVSSVVREEFIQTSLRETSLLINFKRWQVSWRLRIILLLSHAERLSLLSQRLESRAWSSLSQWAVLKV